MEHRIGADLLTRRVRVAVVGVGGNGAQMLHCLARLDHAIRALGHPHGLHVTAFDPDRVSESNVGRQAYSPSDVGQYKALLSVERMNRFYGYDWKGCPARTAEADLRDMAIVVSCVDSAKARRELHRALFQGFTEVLYWLDLGNTEATGQVVLGEVPPRFRAKNRDRLPCVTELYPALLDASLPEDDAPSCSVRMSLASQGLFTNDLIVRFGAQLLYELFSQGVLRHHGVVINVAGKRAAPIDVDPAVWERFGVRWADHEK